MSRWCFIRKILSVALSVSVGLCAIPVFADIRRSVGFIASILFESNHRRSFFPFLYSYLLRIRKVY